MHASGQSIIVSLRISGDGISDGCIGGVGKRPHHVSKVRLGVRTIAGRSLSSERHELL